MPATKLKNENYYDFSPGSDHLVTDEEVNNLELNASGVRKILQEIFPLRRLVLSQFTLYNQLGITIPTGKNFSRGRRCYKIVDLLPVALILALKEQGIPNKNIEKLAPLIQSKVQEIFSLGKGSLVSGFEEVLNLRLLGSNEEDLALVRMLECDFTSPDSKSNYKGSYPIYWTYDVGFLSEDLRRVAKNLYPVLINSEVQNNIVKNNNIVNLY